MTVDGPLMDLNRSSNDTGWYTEEGRAGSGGVLVPCWGCDSDAGLRASSRERLSILSETFVSIGWTGAVPK